MKANRGDTEGMVLVARQEAAQLGSPIYLSPTRNGYVRETAQPRNKHIRVEPTGDVWLVPETTKFPIPGAITEPKLIASAA